MTVNFENQDLDPEQIADQAQIERERAADEGMVPPGTEQEGGDQLSPGEMLGDEAGQAIGRQGDLEQPDVTEVPDAAPGAEG